MQKNVKFGFLCLEIISSWSMYCAIIYRIISFILYFGGYQFHVFCAFLNHIKITKNILSSDPSESSYSFLWYNCVRLILLGEVVAQGAAIPIRGYCRWHRPQQVPWCFGGLGRLSGRRTQQVEDRGTSLRKSLDIEFI